MLGLENLDGWKLLILLLLALLIFGPDKLPRAVADGVKMLRTLRDMARNATTDLSRELGTEVKLEDLHPKTLLRKHLLSEEEERALRRPVEDLYRDVHKDLTGVHKDLTGVRGELRNVSTSLNPRTMLASGGNSSAPEPAASPAPRRPTYDVDAT